MSAERLGILPTLHPECQLTDTTLGAWTEVGRANMMENVVLGDYSYTGPYCIIQNTQIGKFSNIAALVRIGPTDHPMERPTLHHFTYRRRMFGLADTDDEEFFSHRRAQTAFIGHDTWLGHGVIVMNGVTVGHGAVVGSGAVVTKDIPPYAIAVGVPARVVRQRFSDEVAQDFLDLAWWDWPHELLKERLEDFSGPTPAFLEKYRRVR